MQVGLRLIRGHQCEDALTRVLFILMLLVWCLPSTSFAQNAPEDDGLRFNRFAEKRPDILAFKAGGPTERIEIQSTTDNIDYVIKTYVLEQANAAEVIEIIQSALNLEGGSAQAISTAEAGQFIKGDAIDVISVSRNSGWHDMNVTDFRRFPTFIKGDGISLLVITMPDWLVEYMDQTIELLDRADFSAYDDGVVRIHVRPKYRLPSEIAQIIQDSVAGDFTVLVPDNSRQLLYIEDLPSYLSADLEVLQIYDRPALQIETRLRIMEIDEEGLKNVGLDWFSIKDQIAGGGLSYLYSDASIDASLGDVTVALPEPFPPATVSPDGNFDLTIEGFNALFTVAPGVVADLFSYLNQLGVAKTITDTRLTQVNAQPAIVESGNIVPYVLRATIEGTTILGTETDVPINKDENNIIREYREGVFVKMTPRIAEDVEIEVSASVSTHMGYTPNQYVPIINENRVNTVVLLEPGKPAVIGGLIRELEVEENKGVWGLHKIPFLGKAFFTHSITRTRRSLITITIEMEHRRSDDRYSVEAEDVTEEQAFPPPL